MLIYIISQIFGLGAYVCLGMTFFIKSKKNILKLSIINSLLFAIEYVLLGAYSAVAINIVSIVGIVWYYFDDLSNKKNNYISIIVVSILFIVFGILTYNKPVDLIVILASLSYTYSIWQTDILVYRWFGLINSMLWLLYNVKYYAIVGVVFELLCLIVKLIGVIKLYRNKGNVKNNQNLEEKIEKTE